jgi:hypothetical protein
MYPPGTGKRRIPGVAKMNRIDEDGVRIGPHRALNGLGATTNFPLGQP